MISWESKKCSPPPPKCHVSNHSQIPWILSEISGLPPVPRNSRQRPNGGGGGWNSLRFPSGWWQSTHGPRGFGREVCGQRREARHGLKGNPTQHWPVGFWGLEQTFRNMENTTGTSMNIAYIFLGNTYENRYETWKHLWNIWNMMICWSGEIHFGNCDLLLLSLLLLGWDGWSLKKLEGARNFVAWSRPGLNRPWGCEVKNQVIRFIGNYSLDGGFKYFF